MNAPSFEHSPGVPLDERDARFKVFRDDCEKFARDPRLVSIARELLDRTSELFPPARTELGKRHARAATLLRGVQARVVYADGAKYKDPWETWELGSGDCKSSATLLACLCLPLGFAARLVAMGWREKPTHVCAQLKLHRSANWLWAETTMAARLGEHPSRAFERLGGPAVYGVGRLRESAGER